MKQTVIIEMGEKNSFSAYIKDNKLNYGVIGTGKTVQEAINNFYDCFNHIKELEEEEGNKVQEVEFEYKYDVASFFNYYNWINASKFGQFVGINSSLMRQYKKGLVYISEAQAKKIEIALHKAGSEFLSISL